jgi:peroxiredoxin
MKHRNALLLFLLISIALGATVAWENHRFANGGSRSEQAGSDQTGLVVDDDRPVSQHKVTPDMIERAGAMDHRAAPAFHAEATDWANYSLDKIARDGPMVLVFIKEFCPCGEAAQPFYNRLHEGYGASVRFFGVFDGTRERARNWANRHRPHFPLLADPDREIIHAYRAENSAYLVIVAPGGKIDKYWPGYSSRMLKETGERLARLSARPVAALEFSEAPDELYTGCPF